MDTLTSTTPPPDPIDEKIYYILQRGERRRQEIIDLIDEKSDNTIGKRVDNIDQYSWAEIEKDPETNQTTVYMAGERDIIQPKPKADPNKIDALFFEMKRKLNLVKHGQGPTTEPDIFLKSVDELLHIAIDNKNVLYDDQALNRFFRILDEVLRRIKKAKPNEEFEITTRTVKTYRRFFYCAKELHSNWTYNQEHREYDNMLSQRIGGFKDHVQTVPNELGLELQELALSVNKEYGQQYFIELVKSGDYSRAILRKKGFYTYDLNNNISKLFSDLNRIMGPDLDQTSSQEISKLINEIKRLYTSKR